MNKLIQLLNDKEQKQIRALPIDMNKDVKLLTVQELNDIGGIVCETEIDSYWFNNGIIFPAEALRILIKRARKHDLTIF